MQLQTTRTLITSKMLVANTGSGTSVELFLDKGNSRADSLDVNWLGYYTTLRSITFPYTDQHVSGLVVGALKPYAVLTSRAPHSNLELGTITPLAPYRSLLADFMCNMHL